MAIKVKVTQHGSRKFLVMYYDDPVTGKRVQRSTKCSKRKDAWAAAGAWEAELNEGRYKPSTSITWEEFRARYEDEWLIDKSEDMQGTTSTTFNHFENLVGVDRLARVTTEAVGRFQAELRKKQIKPATIATYLRHFHTAIKWAVRKKLLREMPDFDIPKIQHGAKLMRGRPITTEEFERMLAKVEEGILDAGLASRSKKRQPKRRRPDMVLAQLLEVRKARAAQKAPELRRYLRGLWLSGLRLEESLALSWDQDEPFCIDLSGRHPRFRIYAEAQKSRRDQFLPMTPDFAAFILQTPESERNGPVFKVGKSLSKVGAIVSAIGKRAGVVVNKADGKYASAHDLRRAFGTRWSHLEEKPVTLQLLMRHRSIETTMRYYVDQDADEVADGLHQRHGVGTSVGTSEKQPTKTPSRQASGRSGKSSSTKTL